MFDLVLRGANKANFVQSIHLFDNEHMLRNKTVNPFDAPPTLDFKCVGVQTQDGMRSKFGGLHVWITSRNFHVLQYRSCFTFPDAARRHTHMASQQKLGLLPQR